MDYSINVTKAPRSTFHSSFMMADRVHFDGDRDLIGTVTGFCFKYEDGPTVEVSWMHNGTSHVAWFVPWRLTLVA
jgi:hypothetical protein